MSEQIDKVKCLCLGSNGYPCPHINPRLYIGLVGEMTDGIVEEPVDLSDLTKFTQKMVFSEDRDYNAEWETHVEGNYAGDPIYETFTVIPALTHAGRRFTLAIMVGCYLDPDGRKGWRHKYCIKFTGIVTAEGDVIKLDSPLREKGSWEMNNSVRYGFSIILHKE